MSTEEQLCTILKTTLGLGNTPLHAHTALLGNLPQLDSMAVLQVLTALEDWFGIAIADDDIHARHFATVGTLTEFVEARLP